MVVSLTNISPTHGSRYYATEGQMNATEPPSQWSGRLTTTLGLNVGQTVDPKHLSQLLQGNSPVGTVLIDRMRLYQTQAHARVNQKDGPTARAGIDVTTSAPKSVSVQALIFGDRALELAHYQANAHMLAILEDRYAFTRITILGDRQKLLTGKLVIAQFPHCTSRALDPQLHTHNLILNLTQRPDRRWQCLDNEALFRTKMLLGKVYRNELARAVQALGYPIVLTDTRHGLWELQGFPADQLAYFSKRTEHIKTVAGADASSKRKAEVTIFSGRGKKQMVWPEQLITGWQQQAWDLGMTSLVPDSLTTESRGNEQQLAEAMVHRAIAICAKQTSVFAQETLELAALSEIGQVAFTAIAQAIEQSPELIAFHDNKQRLRYRLKGETLDADALQPVTTTGDLALTAPHAGESTTGNRDESSQTTGHRLFYHLHLYHPTPAQPPTGETRQSELPATGSAEIRDCPSDRDHAEPTEGTATCDSGFTSADGYSAFSDHSSLEPDAAEFPATDRIIAHAQSDATTTIRDQNMDGNDDSPISHPQPHSSHHREPSL